MRGWLSASFGFRWLKQWDEQAPQPSQPEARHEAKLRFLCEQDGEPERILKMALHSLLTRRSNVERAYLARVEYGKPSEDEVVLCLAGPVDQTLVSDVAAVFAKQLSRDLHLDILFLDATNEAEVSKVCRPFYGAG